LLTRDTWFLRLSFLSLRSRCASAGNAPALLQASLYLVLPYHIPYHTLAALVC
jgi:hypothetical protein